MITENNPLKLPFFDRDVMIALARIGNTSTGAKLPILRGQVPGRMDLQHSIFRPRGIHPNSLPVKYLVSMEEGVSFELQLMFFWYCTSGDDSKYTLIGLISHDQREHIREQITFDLPLAMQFVVAEYMPHAHVGVVYMDIELLHELQILLSADIFRAREARRQRFDNQDA